MGVHPPGHPLGGCRDRLQAESGNMIGMIIIIVIVIIKLIMIRIIVIINIIKNIIK